MKYRLDRFNLWDFSRCNIYFINTINVDQKILSFSLITSANIVLDYLKFYILFIVLIIFIILFLSNFCFTRHDFKRPMSFHKMIVLTYFYVPHCYLFLVHLRYWKKFGLSFIRIPFNNNYLTFFTSSSNRCFCLSILI